MGIRSKRCVVSDDVKALGCPCYWVRSKAAPTFMTKFVAGRNLHEVLNDMLMRKRKPVGWMSTHLACCFGVPHLLLVRSKLYMFRITFRAEAHCAP